MVYVVLGANYSWWWWCQCRCGDAGWYRPHKFAYTQRLTKRITGRCQHLSLLLAAPPDYC